MRRFRRKRWKFYWVLQRVLSFLEVSFATRWRFCKVCFEKIAGESRWKRVAIFFSARWGKQFDIWQLHAHQSSFRFRWSKCTQNCTQFISKLNLLKVELELDSVWQANSASILTKFEWFRMRVQRFDRSHYTEETSHDESTRSKQLFLRKKSRVFRFEKPARTRRSGKTSQQCVCMCNSLRVRVCEFR